MASAGVEPHEHVVQSHVAEGLVRALNALAVVAVYAFFSLAILYAADTSTRNLVKRIYPMIWKKKKERPTPR